MNRWSRWLRWVYQWHWGKQRFLVSYICYDINECWLQPINFLCCSPFILEDVLSLRDNTRNGPEQNGCKLLRELSWRRKTWLQNESGLWTKINWPKRKLVATVHIIDIIGADLTGGWRGQLPPWYFSTEAKVYFCLHATHYINYNVKLIGG